MTTSFECLDTEELQLATQPKRWIWDGYVRPGQITLFTSVHKSGKTTLLSYLLAQRKAGGELAGRTVARGLSAVVSEESKQHWHERHAHFGFAPGNKFICLPFKGTPSPAEWQEVLDRFKALKAERGTDLVIVDTLSVFLPQHEENHAGLLREGLFPLRALAEAGIAVVLVHHARKAPAAKGMASRGSSMLPAFADILIEMYAVNPHDVTDRRRRLIAFSRDPATPRSLLLELNEERTAYRTVEEPIEDDEFNQNWPPLRMVFEDAKQELTRQEIHEQWPSTFPRPTQNTLWRWLSRAQQRGQIRYTGTGRRADPFRYYLPEKLAEWQDDPLYELRRKMDEPIVFPWQEPRRGKKSPATP